jgi:hypothetical protein
VSGNRLEFTVEFLADATVLEVRRDGRIAKESLAIDNSLVRKDGNTKQLVPKGTMVVAAAEDGNQVFRMNGQPVDKEIDDALSLVISLDAGETSDEDVFGTGESRRLGESWAINRASAVNWLREAHVQVDEEHLRGRAAAVRRVAIENEDCLVMDGCWRPTSCRGMLTESRLRTVNCSFA